MKKSNINAHPNEFQNYDGIIQRPQDPANPKSLLKPAMIHLYGKLNVGKDIVDKDYEFAIQKKSANMTSDSAAALVCLAGNKYLDKNMIEKCSNANKYSMLDIATSFRSHSGP